MKKLITTLSLVLFAVGASYAQAAIIAALFGDKVASEKFNLSMELGVPWSNFAEADDFESTNAINFGIAGNIKLSETWYLSPTAYFLSKRKVDIPSFSLNSTDDNLDAYFDNTPSSMTVAYTDVPIFVYYQPRQTNLRLGLAPQVSFRGSSNVVYEGEYGDFDQETKEFVGDVDYGALLSVGCFFKTAHKGKGIILSARYYNGFSDIFNEGFIPGENRSNYFSIHVSLPFITEELAQKNLEGK